MIGYVFKRVLSLIPILFVVSLVIFFIIHLTPGDPASYILGVEATEEQVESLKDQMGLNAPIYLQYLTWIGGVLQGDFGYSYIVNESVLNIIGNNIIPTMTLALLAQIVAIVLSIPLGILAAIKRGTFIDQTVMIISLLGMAIPSFLLALILVLIFAVTLGWLPVAGYQGIENGIWNHLKFLVLPAISLGTIQAALIARMSRSSMLDVLNKDYIKMSKAKGMNRSRIILKHAFKNSLLPILTVLGQSFGALVTGAVVTETIFNIPGIGQLIVNSIERRDYTVIQGIVLYVTLIYVVINLVVDLLYGLIDPRVRLEKGN